MKQDVFSYLKSLVFKSGKTKDIQNLRNGQFANFLVAGDISRAKRFIHDINPNFLDPNTKKRIITLAVEANDPDLMKTLLQKQPDLNYNDAVGNSPLMTAVSSNHQKIIKLLVEMPKNNYISHTNANRETAIDLALQIDKKSVAKYLIDHDCKTEYTIVNTNKSKNWQLCSWLVENGASPNVRDQDLYSPLILSILNDDLKAFKLWIKLGADINNSQGNGRELFYNSKTPIMMAITLNKIAFVTPIIESSNFDPNLKDDGGASGVFWSACSGDPELFSKVLKLSDNRLDPKMDGTTALMDSCSRNDLAMVSKILQLKIDSINATDNNKWNALMYACHAGFLGPVQLLIENGADLTMQTGKLNLSALNIAESRYTALTKSENEARINYRAIIDSLRQELHST